MRKLNIKTFGYSLFIIGFLFLLTACNNSTPKENNTETKTEEIKKVDEIYWNVKAIQPDGKSLAIKAFNNEGIPFDVKAIQN